VQEKNVLVKTFTNLVLNGPLPLCTVLDICSRL